jgi:pimeloyl-ACP methyl ester carboxylesterase
MRAGMRPTGLLVLALVGGCFSERSFPLRSSDVVHLKLKTAGNPSNPAATAGPQSTRQWLASIVPALRRFLPRQDRPVMLTEQMRDAAGRPVDVYRWFDRNPNKMQLLFGNWWAVQHTAQSIERGYAIEKAPAVWPGFKAVWIPVAPDLQLHGFLGFAEKDSRPISADCIVVLPGLFGDNGALRSRDVSIALRNSGFHVLSFEPRGHGQVEARYPNVYYTYGLLDVQDLMDVSDWLEDTYPHIRRTGLIGFCWGANQALLAAWYDGRSKDDPSIAPALARCLPPPTERVHYAAGVIAFSPVLRWERFLDRMDTPKCVWTDPAPAMFQQANKEHMQRKGFPEVTGSLRTAIAYDIAWSGLSPCFPVQDG